jgi:hypothetical protein
MIVYMIIVESISKMKHMSIWLDDVLDIRSTAIKDLVGITYCVQIMVYLIAV